MASKLALGNVRMCEPVAEPEEPPAAATELSPEMKEMMDTLGGLTLVEAAALIKEVDETFGVGPKKDDEAEAEE